MKSLLALSVLGEKIKWIVLKFNNGQEGSIILPDSDTSEVYASTSVNQTVFCLGILC